MRRTIRTLFMAGVLVLTLGVAAPVQAGKADSVPIKGTLVGSEKTYPAAGTWEAEPFMLGAKTEFDIDGDGQTDYTCSKPAHELIVGTMTGNVSHLGKITREMSYCLVWDGMGGGENFDFSQVLTAANGDTLKLGQGPTTAWEEGDGWVDFGVATPIAGGTGRFVDASGTLHEAGRVTPSWWPPGFYFGTADWVGPWTREVSLSYTRDSYISYDASKRAVRAGPIRAGADQSTELALGVAVSAAGTPMGPGRAGR